MKDTRYQIYKKSFKNIWQIKKIVVYL